MPISGKTFDSLEQNINPKLLDLFITHKSKAYSLTELQKKFGDFILLDLVMLVLKNRIESKSNGTDTFYRWMK